MRSQPITVWRLMCVVGLALLGCAIVLGGTKPGRADTGAGDLPASPNGNSSEASNITALDRRLASQGLTRGAPVLIRIFKEESELELWMQAGDRFRRFATYKICRWRGGLGPKLIEGDRQSPEGFYSFGQDQLLWQGHWFRAFNINYPNTLDRALGRTGSGILIHGACSSIGCYAMTDPVIDEMFDLIVAAFAAGQPRVQVHIFPFHMTMVNLAHHHASPWSPFWRDLKPASDAFVATQLPPRVGVCDGRYVVRPGQAGVAIDPRIRDWCVAASWSGSPDRIDSWLEARHLAATPDALGFVAKPPSGRIVLYAKLVREGKIPKPQTLPSQPASYGPSPEVISPEVVAPAGATAAKTSTLADLPSGERAALLGVRSKAPSGPQGVAETGGGNGGFNCTTALAACRHFIASHAGRPVVLRAAKPKLAKR